VHFDRRDEAATTQQRTFYLADLQFRVAIAKSLLNHHLLGVSNTYQPSAGPAATQDGRDASDTA
jgi:hypothetical protein